MRTARTELRPQRLDLVEQSDDNLDTSRIQPQVIGQPAEASKLGQLRFTVEAQAPLDSGRPDEPGLFVSPNPSGR